MTLTLTRSPFRVSSGRRGDAAYIIRRLGLATNCKLVLDAGEASSYTSGQSWLDLSGNGYDFFLGSTSGAAANDPTFTGTAGQRTSGEYWSFDGGDFFRYDTTNETWMENIHKDNAIFTLAAWVYPVNATTTNMLWGDHNSSGVTVGVHWCYDATEALIFAVTNGSGISFSDTSTITLTQSAWNFVALSLNEATGASGGFHYKNGTSDTFTSTYTSPSASSAAATAEIAAGAGAFPLENGSRLGMFMAWEGTALTTGDLDNIYAATRIRYGV